MVKPIQLELPLRADEDVEIPEEHTAVLIRSMAILLLDILAVEEREGQSHDLE